MKSLKDNSDPPEARHGTLPKTYTSSKRKTRLHSTFPRRNGYSRLRQQKSWRKESAVDSGASMRMVSKKDLNAAELETMRTSRSPTTLMKANGEVLAKEEATVYVRVVDLNVTVMLLENTPAVLSLGKLCEEFGYSFHWTIGHIKSSTIRRTWFINEFLYLIYTFTYFSIIFITRFRI